LHRIPELGRNLPKTTAYLLDYLRTLPCEITPVTDAGFVAFFRAPAASPRSTIAFRTDMDALPIEEATGLDFASEHPGCMHACGHDGHMSMLLGLAAWISENLESLPVNVLLVFQAAEETTGGAKDFCASTVFADHGVKAIYGQHLWPGFPKGTVICRRGDFMASTFVFVIDILGRSTHVGTYRQGIDALEAGAAYISRIYEMEKTVVASDVRRLLRVGRFESGRTANVVPAKAQLEGTLRTYDPAVHELMWSRMLEIAGDIEQQTGARFTLRHSDAYPAVRNPDELFDRAKAALTGAGISFFEPEEPLLIAEDFGCYGQILPSLYLHLGTGVDAALHTNNYMLDEDVLMDGVRVFREILLSYK
jgi:hippurate hydrolase